MTNSIVVQVGRIQKRLSDVALTTHRATVKEALKIAELEVKTWEFICINGEKIKSKNLGTIGLSDNDKVIIYLKRGPIAKIQKFFGTIGRKV